MELGSSDECCREVDEEERLTLAMVVLREWWALGDSPENAKPGSQWQILVSRGLRRKWLGYAP